ncbi:MAG: aminoacyl-tRNA hydrolase [bacterium]|nr:aminoacyl-tRNA hydrolase [bacterium]
MKLIVGLGNPGLEYTYTRHNVGFLVIDAFAEKYGVSFKKKFNGFYGEFFIFDEKVVILKPLSFMNLSGEVVSKFVKYFNITVSDVLVISDDLDLPFCKIRLRLFGSCGGHNGLRNIESHLNSNEFKRFRIGISSDKNVQTRDYVLSNFSREEMKEFEMNLPVFVNVLEDFCSKDFEFVMNKYN